MDLSSLDSSLPAGLADAERDMGDKFRAAALSITNLYKSSLSYKKQAYQVGYSACLADVLSTVQSSIGSGQDAGGALSRLMDWVEAREVAMAAFASEDDEIPPLPPKNKQTTAALAKQALHNLTGGIAEQIIPATPNSIPHANIAHYQHQHQQPTPTTILSSPATPAPTPFNRPPRKTSHSPIRYTHSRPNPNPNALAGGSNSNPNIPNVAPVSVAVVPTSNFTLDIPITSGPSLNVVIGTKRSVDHDMTGEDGTGTATGTTRRSAKRRSMAGHVKEDKEGDEKGLGGERRKGGRRHGGGGAGVL